VGNKGSKKFSCFNPIPYSHIPYSLIPMLQIL
jgi:hypothetical protein